MTPVRVWTGEVALRITLSTVKVRVQDHVMIVDMITKKLNEVFPGWIRGSNFFFFLDSYSSTEGFTLDLG